MNFNGNPNAMVFFFSLCSTLSLQYNRTNTIVLKVYIRLIWFWFNIQMQNKATKSTPKKTLARLDFNFVLGKSTNILKEMRVCIGLSRENRISRFYCNFTRAPLRTIFTATKLKPLTTWADTLCWWTVMVVKPHTKLQSDANFKRTHK